MRAFLCTEPGSAPVLSVQEVRAPRPSPSEVLIEVASCGVNYPDVLMISGGYQMQPDPPFSPGGEIAGVVTAVGADVRGARVGDRVAAAIGWGGMAEQVTVAASGVVDIPDGVSLVDASALLAAHGTAFHALHDRAGLRPGETLLVLGAAGGVGLAAVELGALAGARVIAAASTDEKLELCRSRGATATINYATQDVRSRIREETDGAGIDVCFDPVGGSLTEAVVRSMAWEGRHLVVGFAAGEIPRLALNLPLLKGCSVVGVFYGAHASRRPDADRANVVGLLAMLEAGELRPHIADRVPLDRAHDAISALGDRRAEGKLVVLPRDSAA